jgi:hypothetical protein
MRYLTEPVRRSDQYPYRLVSVLDGLAGAVHFGFSGPKDDPITVRIWGFEDQDLPDVSDLALSAVKETSEQEKDSLRATEDARADALREGDEEGVDQPLTSQEQIDQLRARVDELERRTGATS